MLRPPSLTLDPIGSDDNSNDCDNYADLGEIASQTTHGLVDVGCHDLQRVREIGRGTQGLVELHRHIPTGTLFAVKSVPADLSPETRRLLLREIRNLYRCNHPNIVSVHGAYFMDGYAGIVLELLEGGTLQSVLDRRGPFPHSMLAEIARQMLEGLKHLHGLGILHRDIKPSNFLVDTRYGLVKISDFGMSADMEASHTSGQKTSCTTWVGSLRYMSPEKLRGECYRFDSDVWSLGVTVYQLATGKFPLPEGLVQPGGDVFWDLLSFFNNSDECSVDETLVNSTLCDFLKKILKKNPQERASIDELSKHPFISNNHKPSYAELVAFFSK